MQTTSFKIGNIDIEYPVILAPMSGVTDMPFRRLVNQFGAGLLVSEMIASRAMIIKTRDSLKKATIAQDEGVTSLQLAGFEPDVMAEAAQLNVEMGAKIIDINFGCPVKKVVNGYAGSALMKDEERATKILQAVTKAVSVPVTLKMRTGWDDSNRNAPKLAKIAEDAGIKMITIHGRTRCQMYRGKADWSFIKQVKNAVSLPVIANGDINNFSDIDRCLNESGADGIMIGRGAYGKPWFISQAIHYLETGKELESPSIKEKLNIVLGHYDEMIDHYGPEVGVRIARKHIGWYSSGLHGSSEFRQKVNKLSNHLAVKEEIAKYFMSVI